MKTDAIAAFLRRAANDPRRRELGLHAAAGTYYLFLSLGPLTALLLAILPYTPLSEEQVMGTVLAAAPTAFRRLMQGVVRDVYAGSKAVLGLSLLLELWSGARFLAAVTRGVASMTGGLRAGYLRRRVTGAAYTAALLALTLGDLTLLLFGERLLLAAAQVNPALLRLWHAVLFLRPEIFFLGLVSANVLLFRRSPRRRGGLREVLPGAVFSAAAWMLFSRVYSLAAERFGLFGVYGSIAAAAGSLYWIYVSLYILFAGAWLSALPLSAGAERESGGA